MAKSCFLQFWIFWQFRRFCQSLRALPRPIQWRMSCAGNTPFSGHTSSPLEAAEAGTQTVRHSPQSCRPFWGFPRASQVLFLTAVLPAPLPSEHSVQYTKGTFRVKQNLRFLYAFFTVDEAFMPDLSPVEERPFRAASREQQNGALAPAFRFLDGGGVPISAIVTGWSRHLCLR